MVFQLGSALLDACVLAVIAQEDCYGYRLTSKIKEVMDISESTLYPVLRRLQKDECLEIYDRAIDGRNRRYYKITGKGDAQLNLYKAEWLRYSKKITAIFEGGQSVG